MSATLQAAVRAGAWSPEVLARFADLPCERPRLAMAECYAGSEGDQPHAAVATPRGTVLRLRTPPGGGSIYQARVTDVASASQWAAWTMAPGFSAGSPPRVEVAADPTTGQCWRYVVGGLGEVVYYATSGDDGASWSGWAQAFSAGQGNYVVGIAAYHEDGVGRLCVAVNPGGGSAADNYLAMLGYSGGAWTPLGETARDHPPIDGIGMAKNAAGDLYVLVAEGPPSRLAFREFTLGASQWGAAGVALEAGAGSVVSFAEPRYWRLAEENRAVITYVERSSAPVYQRAMICFTPVRWWLTEEVPWRFPTTRGVEVLRTADSWLAVGSDRAYRAPRYAGSAGETLDVPGERVVALESRLRVGEPGRLRLLVENSDGRYAPGAGDATCVRPGAQLGIRLGLRTAAGSEGVWQAPWWVERVGSEASDGEGCLVVEARDASGELAALRARRQYQWAGATLGDVVQRCWWRVCGRAEAVPHGNMVLVVPYFAVGAGESWGDAIERLCRMTGTLLRWRNESATGVGWDAAYPEVVDFGQGASVWAFDADGADGNDGQLLLGGSFWQGASSAQRVEVFGSGQSIWAEYRDWARVWDEWRDTGVRVVDLKLDAPGEVADRAAWEWRRLGAGSAGGVVRVAPVPGLEPGDVVTVTEPRAGLAGAARTVVGIRTRLDRRRDLWEQEVELAGGTDLTP